MPHYHFHMASKKSRLVDEKGSEMASLSAAHEHAVHMICTLISNLPAEETEGWMVKISNGMGAADLVVLFPRRDTEISRCFDRHDRPPAKSPVPGAAG